MISPLDGALARRLLAFGCLLALGQEPVAHAEPNGADGGESQPSYPRTPAEPPHVRLSVEPGGEGVWTLHLENIDSIPLRIVEDPRLLSLDVTPAKPAHAATVHCTLPAEMRPSTDEEHVAFVQPRASYVESFDPRLYCFSAAQDRALAPGAKVVARFGFGSPKKRHAPFVVALTKGFIEATAETEIVSEPMRLPDAAAEADAEPPAPSATTLSVSTPPRLDALSMRDLSLTVTVTNPTSRRVSLLLRPETIAIEAMGPYGSAHCQWLVAPAPIAELFSNLPPKGRASTEVLVSTLCPAGFFDRPGLYSLEAVLDTRRVSGSKIGISSFVGKVPSKAATLLRLRTVPSTRDRE